VASVVGCKAGTSQSSTPIAATPPVHTLEGDYLVARDIYMYDPETGGDVLDGEDSDILSIRKAPNEELNVKIKTVAYNYDQCYFDQTMTPSGPHQWHWKGGDMHPGCEVILAETTTSIVITSNWDCYHEFCGNRATLEGTFPKAEWRPAGSYEWPEL